MKVILATFILFTFSSCDSMASNLLTRTYSCVDIFGKDQKKSKIRYYKNIGRKYSPGFMPPAKSKSGLKRAQKLKILPENEAHELNQFFTISGLQNRFEQLTVTPTPQNSPAPTREDPMLVEEPKTRLSMTNTQESEIQIQKF